MSKLDALWQYQLLDMEKDRLEKEPLNSPARIKLNKLYGFLSEQQAAIGKLQKEMEQKQAVMEKLAAEIDALQKQMELEHSELEHMLKDEECTAEEYTECRENIEKLQARTAASRKDLSDLLKWIEQAMKEYRETRNRAGKAKKEYDAMRLVCEQEKAAAEGPIKEAAAKVEAQEKLVDPALLTAYKRVKKNYAQPMAKLENDQCGGCNMSLPTVVTKRVKGDNVVTCENCGRILYTAE